MANAKQSAIETELQKMTGIKPNSKEKRQAYLQRMSAKLDDMTDDDWNSLSSPAQIRANVITKTKEGDIPDFEVDEATAPAKKDNGKGKPAAKKAAPAKAPAKKSSGSDAPKEDGIKVLIKRLVLKDPKTSVDDIVAALEKRGTTASRMTVAGIRAEFRHTLRFLQAEGLIKAIID